MGVTYQDVEMLNNSMRYAGGAFRQTRLDAEQLKQQQIENELRERTLKAGQDRTDLAAAGEVSAYLSGEDGGMVEYKGSPQGLQKVMSEAAAKGKPLRQVSAPTKPATIGTFSTHTPLGDFTFHLNDVKDVDHVSELARQIGGKQKESGQFNTAPIANAAHLESLQAAVDAAKTPDEKAQAERKLATFMDLVKAQRPDPEDYETVTEDYDAQEATPPTPADPGSKGFLGFGARPPTPGTPGTPPTPRRHISYKRKRGTELPAPDVAQQPPISEPDKPQPERTAGMFSDSIKEVHTPPPMPEPSASKTAAARKAAMANKLAKANPTWTREQIIAEVNKQFTE